MPWPLQPPIRNFTELRIMTTIRRSLCALLLIAAPALATAGGRLPDEAVGKVEGIYREVAPDVYRLATDHDVKQGTKLWADIRFSKAATGKARSAFVRVSADAATRPEQGDLVQVRLAQPLHTFAYALGPMTDRDTLLALQAKFFTEAAVNYDREPGQTARFR
jgi:hypothetical protein